MQRLIPFVITVLALILTLPVIASSGQLPSKTMSDKDKSVIDAGINSILKDNPEIPAIYIGVWDPQRGAYQQAYGLADVANKRPASIEDHFRIGSVTKSFMATIMLLLVDEGIASLTDTVAETVPDLAEQFPSLAAITIEQLLGMTSGIPDYMNVRDAAVAALVETPATEWTPEQLIRFGVDGEIQPAGTGGYSTTNYIILQEIAEKLTGESIQELIRKKITEPLGMNNTALPYNKDTMLPEPFSHGYLSTACTAELEKYGAKPIPAGTDTTDWNASYGQGGGGMHSTIADLGIWAASMGGNALLSDELAKTRLQWKDINAAPFMYGLGIIKFMSQIGHEGEAIGWEGWTGHDPDTGLTAVVFTNSCADLIQVIEGLSVVDPAFAPIAKAFSGK